MKSENKRVIKLEFEIENSWNWIAQDKDGSISIPKVLRPYMNNLEKISIN